MDKEQWRFSRTLDGSFNMSMALKPVLDGWPKPNDGIRLVEMMRAPRVANIALSATRISAGERIRNAECGWTVL